MHRITGPCPPEGDVVIGHNALGSASLVATARQ